MEHGQFMYGMVYDMVWYGVVWYVGASLAVHYFVIGLILWYKSKKQLLITISIYTETNLA